METDIYATATDYDPRSDLTKSFFATVQNKLYFAVHEHTAAEVIYERVDNEKPLVGMTNFKCNYITKDDVKIAKKLSFGIRIAKIEFACFAVSGLCRVSGIRTDTYVNERLDRSS